MTNVKMKAIDQLHISAVSQHNLQPGEGFEVSKAIADDLEARGLAAPLLEEPATDAGKSTATPPNKAEKTLSNKGS